MKFRRFLSALLACTVVGAAAPVMRFDAPAALTAQALAEYTEGTYDVLTYANYGDYIEITDCDDDATSPYIPSEIDGVPVMVIGNYAFASCENITSIFIPDSVISIGNYAFEWCENLTDIIIPDSVTDIGDGAFYECTSLANVILPDSLTTVGNYAFANCKALKSIILPDGVSRIGHHSLAYCDNLARITIPESLTSIGHNAFDMTPWLEEQETSNDFIVINGILLKAVNIDSEFNLPDGITSIGEGAFAHTYCLSNIVIPDGVTSIEYEAFSDCGYLLTVVIPDSVVNIGALAFSWCRNLSGVVILNPDCNIMDNPYTFHEYSDNDTSYFSGTIYGYKGSTAQAYAEKYGRKFIALIKGDVYGDGVINAIDASMVLSEYAAKATGQPSTFNVIRSSVADVNSDGNIDALDASEILSYYSYTATGGKLSFDEWMVI